MKKTYVKPEILFEDFALSTNIAGDCASPTNTALRGECGLEATGVPGGFVFVTGMTGCSFGVDGLDGGDGQFGNLCYHIPVNQAAIFNS